MEYLRIKILLLFAVFIMPFSTVVADNGETFIVMRKDTGYSSDVWWCNGAFPASKIKEEWNSDRRITTAAYNANGWFMSASKNTGITMQTYYFEKAWPKQWIDENFAKGYRISSVAVGEDKWFIVMSQGTGLGNQVWFQGDNNTLGAKIQENWNKGYRITSMCQYYGQWFVVMSQNSKYSMQTYCFNTSKKDAFDWIQKHWNEGYRITAFAGNDTGSVFFSVVSKMANGSVPGETYINSSSPSESINKNWREGYCIAYIGGSKFKTTNNTTTNPSVNRGNGTPSQIVESNFSQGGVPNLSARYAKYVIGDNWRETADGKTFYDGDGTVDIDMKNKKATVRVAGQTHTFDLYIVGYGEEPYKRVNLYTTREGNTDECISLMYMDYEGVSTNNTEYCFINSASRGLDITFNTFINSAEIRSFMAKVKAYLAR